MKNLPAVQKSLVLTPAERRAAAAKAKAERQARIARRKELAAAKRVIPFPLLRARISELVKAGGTDEQIARKAADWIDQTLTFAGLPRPFDAVAEALDGPLAYAIALPLVQAARRALAA